MTRAHVELLSDAVMRPVAVVRKLVDDRLARDDRADREPAAQVLRDGQHVGHDTLALEGPHRAELGEAGLLLVEDQQRAARARRGGDSGEPARRGLDHAARREDRLR